jgi:gp16 family phage-associated protein
MTTTVHSPYKDRIAQVRHQLEKEGKSFKTWAEENGYKPMQVYVVTRRYEPARFGTALEIAKKLGLLAPSTESSN